MLPAFAPRTTAAGTMRLQTGFTDGQHPAFNVLAVESGNRLDGFSVTHVNDPNPSASSRLRVSHDADSRNGSAFWMLLKPLLPQDTGCDFCRAQDPSHSPASAASRQSPAARPPPPTRAFPTHPAALRGSVGW